MAETVDLPTKLIRPKGQATFRFRLWDGTPVQAAKHRTDHGDGRGKKVVWRPTLKAEGLSQADLAPWNWHDAIAAHKQNGLPVVVTKGELKASWLQGRGIPSISINEWNTATTEQLLQLGDAVVLAPDCDLADLRGWYAKAVKALPQVRHLLVPGANWAAPPEKDGVGIDDWLQINLESATPNTADDLLAAITDQPWQSPDDGGGDDRAGRPQPLSGADLLLFVEDNYEIEWDELLQRPVVNGVTPKGEDQKLFYLDISNRFPDVKAKKDEARDALRYIAKQHSFNPVARYIEGLKEKASGGELQLLPLQEIAGRGFGLDDCLSQELLARKLVQQLKRGLCPGYKADEMAIIQGSQGGYKTEAIQALCPEPAWCVTTSDVKDTEGWAFLLKLSQSWFYLLDECDKFLRGKDSSTLKSVITNRQDSYALKNLNDVDSFARPSTFWGTTNETELFNDHTGVRRWWLLKQGEGRRADPSWIRRNRDSIWATAYTWAMWGLESYLPRGSEVEKAAAARAWAATYELDGADKFSAVLNSRPLQPDGLPAPISQQALFMAAAEVDLGRLWANNRRAARDLIGDVKRTITSETFRTHDGQVKWIKDKRRLDGYPNPVQGFWPELLTTTADPAAAAKDPAATADPAAAAKDPAGFMPDPIPLVPIRSDAVPNHRNGQTPWQNSDLRELFQCSNQKKEKRKGDPVASSAVRKELCSNQLLKKTGTLEQEPQIPSAAVDLPVPIHRSRTEQNAEARNSENGTAASGEGTPLSQPGTEAAPAAAVVVPSDPPPEPSPEPPPASTLTTSTEPSPAPPPALDRQDDQMGKSSTPLKGSTQIGKEQSKNPVIERDLVSSLPIPTGNSVGIEPVPNSSQGKTAGNLPNSTQGLESGQIPSQIGSYLVEETTSTPLAETQKGAAAELGQTLEPTPAPLAEPQEGAAAESSPVPPSVMARHYRQQDQHPVQCHSAPLGDGLLTFLADQSDRPDPTDPDRTRLQAALDRRIGELLGAGLLKPSPVPIRLETPQPPAPATPTAMPASTDTTQSTQPQQRSLDLELPTTGSSWDVGAGDDDGDDPAWGPRPTNNPGAAA